MTRIAAAIIAGDTHEPTAINACLHSLDGYVDGIYIAYNGEADTDQFLLPAINPPIFLQKFEWEDDFSVARNQSFGMIPKEAYDWILWIDTDDTLEAGDELQETIALLKPDTQGVFLRYDYAVEPKTETVLAVQWRERLLRTDANWKWHYPIHEICHAPANTQYEHPTGAYIRHHRVLSMDAQAATRERNRRILLKARKEFPEEPRFDYYLANEVYAEAAEAIQQGRPALELLNAAIKAYDDYIPNAPSPDDAYISLHQIAECRRMAEDYHGAIKADTEALLVHPSWADAYVGIAQSYMEMQDWDRCRHWARMCLNNSSEAETTQVREPLNDEYLPRLLIAMADEAQGFYPLALKQYQDLLELGLSVNEVQGKIDSVIKKQNEADDRPKPIIKIPDPEDRDTRPSICFFHRPLFEQWHPDIIREGGIGGSELATIELSERFARDGWRVRVHGSPGDHAGIDARTGVEWAFAHEWKPTDEYDVFISSRTPEIFDHNIKADLTVLWMHDVNVGPQFDGPWGPRITDQQPTYVAGLTDWHINHLRRLYKVPEEKLIIIPNGVNPDRFGDTSPDGIWKLPNWNKQRGKFAWSSSPDRGLDIVLNLWAEIRAEIPDAELHIFYGWAAIDRILELNPDHPLKDFRDSMEKALDMMGREEAGIYWHDRVNQKQLAEHLLTCDMWLYPTYFLETFCITALEMQMAGVIPVATNAGGLQETIGDKSCLITGWPNNFDYQDRWLARVFEIYNLSEEEKLSEYRLPGLRYAENFTWEHAYGVWNKLIDDELKYGIGDTVNPNGDAFLLEEAILPGHRNWPHG